MNPIRAAHLDLKGLPPTPARLLQLLDLFAAAGFNAVLVEWEDAFPWECDSRFRSPTAYNVDVVDAFHSRARQLGLRVIPLVQTLGHMETPLRFAEYQSLRELPDRCDVLNPLAAGAGELVERMIDDVLRRSGPITHMHLGGDEAFTFGRQSDTKAYIERHGKAALYLHHVRPLCERLIARGIRPILWHDMMVDWQRAALEQLGQIADVMVWTYRASPRLETIARFRDAGANVWGACAFKGADGYGDGVLPDVAARVTNSLAWADAAEQQNLTGVAATGWSRYSTHRWQCEPIDGALDALVKVGLVLRDGAQPHDREAEQILRAAGEWERFIDCKDALSRLARAKRDAWAYIILIHEQAELERIDSSRRGSGILDELHRIATDHVAAAEAASQDVRHALQGRIEDRWIDQFVHERLQPLRDAPNSARGSSGS